MDCPRNHPGAFADVGHEHDRYDSMILSSDGDVVRVTLRNVQAGSELHGTEKQFSLLADARLLCVTYALSPKVWRVSSEVSLSPDYHRLLREGREGLVAFSGRDYRGWRSGSVKGSVRKTTRPTTVSVSRTPPQSLRTP
jgi:hypothetical protein